ncbi:Lipid-binding SYLF domain-containing protein [Flavobacteriaceae bacterium MAR_2010_188]|nr:Lipid-binding SYLF domain-containing protein [Flavobacteriaceae bacterium MAR_2010_188]
MKTNKLILLLMLCFSVTIFAQDDDDMDDMSTDETMVDNENDHAKLMADADAAIDSFKSTDASMAQKFSDAVAYVIFPNVGKGALVVGVSSGNGVVYENGVMIGTADLKKLDIGLQAGGKAFSEAIIFNTDEAFQKFKNNELEFAANASAVVLKSGKSAEAKFNDGVAVFAMPKGGLMAEASVGGQKFEFSPWNN